LLTVRAGKDTQVLLFSSPVFGEGDSADVGNGAGCAPDLASELPTIGGAGSTHSNS
jgi:hypothetical protein